MTGAVTTADSSLEQGIRRTRDRIVRMRRLAATGDEQDGVELFAALCDYLDQLHGEPGFDRLLPVDLRSRVASMITRILADAPSGSAPQRAPDVVRRLNQPVNAAVTLAEGRRLARRLAAGTGWPGDLGVWLTALYDYLDKLHGGRFTQLLNSVERRAIAALIADYGRP